MHAVYAAWHAAYPPPIRVKSSNAGVRCPSGSCCGVAVRAWVWGAAARGGVGCAAAERATCGDVAARAETGCRAAGGAEPTGVRADGCGAAACCGCPGCGVCCCPGVRGACGTGAARPGALWARDGVRGSGDSAPASAKWNASKTTAKIADNFLISLYADIKAVFAQDTQGENNNEK